MLYKPLFIPVFGLCNTLLFFFTFIQDHLLLKNDALQNLKIFKTDSTYELPDRIHTPPPHLVEVSITMYRLTEFLFQTFI